MCKYAATLEKTPVFVKEGGAMPITYGEDLNIGTINTVDKKVVTAKGAIADKVVVDGKELSELTERPTLNTMTQKCVL